MCFRLKTACSRCLVPAFDGELFSSEWKDALWGCGAAVATAAWVDNLRERQVFGAFGRNPILGETLGSDLARLADVLPAGVMAAILAGRRPHYE
jgi:hypothetical protein